MTLPRSIRATLVAILILTSCSLHAQLRITKRKHLKGFHIERIGARKNNANECTVNAPETTSPTIEDKLNEVRLPVISSPQLELATSGFSIQQSNQINRITRRSKVSLKRKFFIPNGAGLFREKPKRSPEYIAKRNHNSAIAGFIMSLLIYLAVIPELAPLGLLIFFALAYSIRGIKSDLKWLGILGTIFSGLIILAAFVAFLVAMYIFSPALLFLFLIFVGIIVGVIVLLVNLIQYLQKRGTEEIETGLEDTTTTTKKKVTLRSGARIPSTGRSK